MLEHEYPERLRQAFLGWQCRIRQYAVRRGDGRPTAGMRPRAKLADGTVTGPVITLIVKSEPAESIAQFRHIVKKTFDPAERYKAAVQLLQATYYQSPDEFADTLTALFNADSTTAAGLAAAGTCVLEFEQSQQAFRLPCSVRILEFDDPVYQATYWHNALFNPNLPEDVRVLAFTPDWANAKADPPVTD